MPDTEYGERIRLDLKDMRDILGNKIADEKVSETQTFPQGNGEPSSPRAMVTAPDGTQHPVSAEEASIPKYHPEPKPESAAIEPPAPPAPPPLPPALDDGPRFETAEPSLPEPPVPDPAPLPQIEPLYSMGTFEMRPEEVMKTEEPAAPAQAEMSLPESEMPTAPETSPQTESETHYLAPLEPESNALTERRRYTVEELQHILEGHDLWLQTSGQNGKRANFRNANLQYVILSGFALSDASFRGADLSFADLSQSDLRNADLSEALLQQTSFASANLAGATFARADMRTAILEGAHCEGTDFTGAGLIGANLAHLNLAGANFESADMQSASLAGSNLEGASLRLTNMVYANLSQANLAGAQCRDTNFDCAVLDYAILEGASLKGANLTNASLNGVDLTHVEDVSIEYQHGLIDAERQQLEQQWAAIKAEQQRLEQEFVKVQQRETNVQMEKHKAERVHREALVEKESMDRLLRSAQEVIREHYTHDRMFRYIGAMWFIFGMLILTGVLLFLNALELKQLNGIELAIVLIGCGCIMGLAALTVVRSLKLSNNLKKLLIIYEKGFGPLKS